LESVKIPSPTGIQTVPQHENSQKNLGKDLMTKLKDFGFNLFYYSKNSDLHKGFGSEILVQKTAVEIHNLYTPFVYPRAEIAALFQEYDKKLDEFAKKDLDNDLLTIDFIETIRKLLKL